MTLLTILRVKLFDWLPAIIAVVALVIAWEVLVGVLEVQRWLLPPPSVIINELFDSLASLSRHAGTTASETVIGFAVSIVLA
jgi:ABC-type nitrate/sulfonate/bicarbonate transport system permease component